MNIETLAPVTAGLKKAIYSPATYIGASAVGCLSLMSNGYAWGSAVPFIMPVIVQALSRINAEFEKIKLTRGFKAKHREHKSKIIEVINGSALTNILTKHIACSHPKTLVRMKLNYATEVVRLTDDEQLIAEEKLIKAIHQKICAAFHNENIYRLAKDTFLCVIDGNDQQVRHQIELFVAEHSPLKINIGGNDYYPKLISGVTPLISNLAITMSLLEYACLKAAQRAQFSYYYVCEHDEEAIEHLRKRKELRTVRQAIDSEELGLFAQPIVPIDGQISLPKYELLLRHYTHDRINSPFHILNIATYNDMVQDIDIYVVELLCKNFSRLFGASGDYIDTVAINLSGSSYSSPHFNEALISLFAEYNIPPNKIVLEITEDIANDNIEHAITTMNYFKEQGFKLALDDIGIGSSNFKNLTRFPVDYYKIDRSYTETVVNNESVKNFIKLIICEAKRRNKQVIAEGVPDQKAKDYLTSLGVNYSQSYITGLPEELIKAPSLNQLKPVDHQQEQQQQMTLSPS